MTSEHTSNKPPYDSGAANSEDSLIRAAGPDRSYEIVGMAMEVNLRNFVKGEVRC